MFKKDKKKVPLVRKRTAPTHGIKGLPEGGDPDVEWFCDGSDTGLHTDHIIVKTTGKDNWAYCPTCHEHVRAKRRRLDRVTVIKTAFCHAIVPIEMVSAGMAMCPTCKSNEPVFADTKDVEDILG